MNRRKMAWVTSGILVIVGLCAAAYLAFMPSGIRISQETVQNIVNERLPHQLPRPDWLRVTGATVQFGDDAAQLRFVVEGTHRLTNRDVRLEAETIGRPEYNSAQGAFYFRLVPGGTHIVDVSYTGRGPGLRERAAAMVERYRPEAGQGFRNAVEDLARYFEGRIEPTVERAAIRTLEHRPVYRLPDTNKGWLTKMVLDEVRVENGELVVTFTLWRLTTTVLIALLVVVCALGMMVALVRNPGLLAPLEVLGAIGDL